MPVSSQEAQLIRAIVAAFWIQPYDRPLVHWGTALLDRFLLSHFAWQDLCDAIGELRSPGIDLDPAWFVPHDEFRFPKIGEVQCQNTTMHIRSAIERWYVLGEEPGGGSTVRCVDSSVERLEVLVDGFEPTRFGVLCNGVNVPLRATSVQGQSCQGSVSAPGSRPTACIQPSGLIARCGSKSSIGGMLNRSADAPSTWRILADEAPTAFQSTPTKPNRGGRPGSIVWH